MDPDISNGFEPFPTYPKRENLEFPNEIKGNWKNWKRAAKYCILEFFYFENTFWVITPRISFRPKCWKNFDKKSVILCKQKYFSNSIWKWSWSEHFLNFSALTFFGFSNDILYFLLVKIRKIRTKTVNFDHLIFQHRAEKIFEFFYLKLPPWLIKNKNMIFSLFKNALFLNKNIE